MAPLAVPSRSASANPPMTVSGVRRSWRTSASSWRCDSRDAVTSAAIALNAALASATSDGPSVGRGGGIAPRATSLEASASRRSGRVTDRDSPTASGTPMSTRMSAATLRRADEVRGRELGRVVGAGEDERGDVGIEPPAADRRRSEERIAEPLDLGRAGAHAPVEAAGARRADLACARRPRPRSR